MIIFSDLHLDNDSADVCLGKILPGICEAARSSDRLVVFLGDWWHLRYRVDVRLQVAVRDELLRWHSHGVKVKILVGNHDQVNIAGRNALEVFDSLHHVDVYSNPMLEDSWVWLPYRTDTRHYHVLREYFPGRTVFVHQAFAGAWVNDGHFSSEGMDPKDFTGARVFAGHYHRRQRIEAKDAVILYVGSPRQVTAAEAGQPKGFCVLEGELAQFIDENWGPRYHRFVVGEGEQLDLTGVAQGDDVRVTVANAQECGRIGNQLDVMGVRHTVTPEVQPAEVRYGAQGAQGLRDYAAIWAKEHGEDSDRLLRVFDSMVGVA